MSLVIEREVHPPFLFIVWAKTTSFSLSKITLDKVGLNKKSIPSLVKNGKKTLCYKTF